MFALALLLQYEKNYKGMWGSEDSLIGILCSYCALSGRISE